nr:MAG TPA: hypothetical protein [Caudoviricetes sp.]
MAKIYYKAVKAGTRTLESVPERWRAQVEAMLKADEKAKD